MSALPDLRSVYQLTSDEPAADLFRQALNIPPAANITVIVSLPLTPLTLLFEVWDPFKPMRPAKRYLFCNDNTRPSQVTAVIPSKARELIGLLSHPEIHVTPLDAHTAIEEYLRLEETNPSQETLDNGHPRQYTPPNLR